MVQMVSALRELAHKQPPQAIRLYLRPLKLDRRVLLCRLWNNMSAVVASPGRVVPLGSMVLYQVIDTYSLLVSGFRMVKRSE